MRFGCGEELGLIVVDIRDKLESRMCLSDDAEEWRICVKGYYEVHNCYHSTSVKNG